jgi:predicted ATPase
MRRVVITGGPGAGKTTLLTELAAKGYATVSESAREVIAARSARGLPPRPDPITFAREILKEDDAKYRSPTQSDGTIFYDWSAVEALGMVHEVSLLSDEKLKEGLAHYNFHPTVFVLPPWQAIYVNDAERDHSFSHAVAVHAQVVRWYQRCGYHINEVPRLEVAQRANHVLQAIANDA